MTRLFPAPRAGSSMPGKPPAVANGEQATATRSGVPPIDPLMLHRIMDRKPAPYAANDRGAPEGDPAVGGFWGALIMVSVAFWIGVALAIGRAL